VIYVAWLGHTDDRVDQQAAVHFFGGALGQLFVYTVHRVAGLESDHIGVAHRFQAGAYLRRGAAQLDEVVVAGRSITFSPG
jgi:hypothetical protein